MQKHSFSDISLSACNHCGTRANMLNWDTTFGSPLFGRTYQADTLNGYRFGFNGKETDSESDLQDYGMRIYDSRLGRFLSVDPVSIEYPELTPYQFASNTPIEAFDIDGLEKTRTKPSALPGIEIKIELPDNVPQKPLLAPIKKDDTEPPTLNSFSLALEGSLSGKDGKVSAKIDNSGEGSLSASNSKANITLKTNGEIKATAKIIKSPSISVNKIIIPAKTGGTPPPTTTAPAISPTTTPFVPVQHQDALSIYAFKAKYSTIPSNTTTSSFDIGVYSTNTTTTTFNTPSSATYTKPNGQQGTTLFPVLPTMTKTYTSTTIGFLNYKTFDVSNMGLKMKSYEAGALTLEKGFGKNGFGLKASLTVQSKWLKKGN